VCGYLNIFKIIHVLPKLFTMKNTILIITALMMLLAACSKDEQGGKKIILSEMSQIESDIIDFLEKIDNEYEGSLPTGDAVFFLEAGFNYRYAHLGNDQEFTSTRIDTSYLNLDIIDGHSSYAEMKATFDDIFDEMSVLFEAIEDDEKALSIIQVTHEDDNSLRVISVWKHAVLPYAGDWKWGLKAGKCDGTQIGRDATDAIKFFYSINFGTPVQFGIWTNVAYTPYFYADCHDMNHIYTVNPFGHYASLLFGYDYMVGSPQYCMPQNEIFYYATLISEAMHRIQNASQITNTIMHIDLSSTWVTSGGSSYPYLHMLRLKHGDFQPTNHVPFDTFSSI
jgi:hypothetical protein